MTEQTPPAAGSAIPSYGEAYESQWERNAHGVEGSDRRGRFVPRLCWECPLFDGDSDEDGWNVWYFCTRNVKFPTRKGSCRTRDKEIATREAPR